MSDSLFVAPHTKSSRVPHLVSVRGWQLSVVEIGWLLSVVETHGQLSPLSVVESCSQLLVAECCPTNQQLSRVRNPAIGSFMFCFRC